MDSLKILILGRSGKMGQLVEAELTKTYQIFGPVNRLDKVDISDKIDLCIDFSSPENLNNYLSELVNHHIKLISGTTGFTADQFERLKVMSNSIAIFHSTNFSIGIQVLVMAAQLVNEKIGNLADIDIIEKHHSGKKDKPSGTALTIAESIQKNSAKKIKQHSIRAGKIIGDHTVQFSMANEIIEISHHAIDRSVFAAGAASVIPFIMGRETGFYTMTDFIVEGEK